ncbi:hypothetical protein AOLI_G00248130 [Acnodon oligacanthus]
MKVGATGSSVATDRGMLHWGAQRRSLRSAVRLEWSLRTLTDTWQLEQPQGHQGHHFHLLKAIGFLYPGMSSAHCVPTELVQTSMNQQLR